MGKFKLPILVSVCILLVLSLAGFLLLSKKSSSKDIQTYTDIGKAEASTVSPGAMTINPDNLDSSLNYTYIPPTYEYDNNKNSKEDQMSNNEPTKAPWTPATEIDLDSKSITVYVNKEYCLPKYYVPENLVVPNITFDTAGNSERKFMRVEAAEAIEKMFAAALDEGITLYGISGYRSYDRQKEIFLNNIVHKGKKHTLKYSAVPGTSEHQTGLAMDVSSKSVRYKLITSFANCVEGKWLADNAHLFGFIIRYPKDQYDFTGYAYEPWHIRYVGEDLADYLYINNMTLDEYYKYVPSEGFDYEQKYADLINYKPPVTPTPIPEEDLEEEDTLDDADGGPEDGSLEDDDLEDGDLRVDESEDNESVDSDLEDNELEDNDLEVDDPDKTPDDGIKDNPAEDNIEDNIEDRDSSGESKDDNKNADEHTTPLPTITPTATPTPMPTPVPTSIPSTDAQDNTSSINPDINIIN